jgi:protein-disulfide isomerase
VYPRISRLLVALIALTGFAAPAYAADDFSAGQKTAIEQIIKDYLHEHPEIIMESVENYRTKQEQDAQAKTEEAIVQKLDWLAAADAPSVGNPKADVTVVEFFDYNCGYCKRAMPDVKGIVESDKNVRFVFREMPILSPESRMMSQWALAAHKQGKYFEYHVALMDSPGPKDAAALEQIAKDVGLDTAKLKADAASQEVTDMLEADLKAAQEIGIQGTPAFIINGTMYPGYLGPEGLKQSIESAREKGDKKEG